MTRCPKPSTKPKYDKVLKNIYIAANYTRCLKRSTKLRYDKVPKKIYIAAY